MQKIPDHVHRIALLSGLTFKDILRRRVTLLLLFIIPALFDLIILVTTSEQQFPVIFGILPDDTIQMVNRRALSFVFLGIAAVCFLTSFLAFYLVYRRTEPDRRLALCGYRPIEIIISKMLVLIVIILSIAIYEGLIIRPFFEPQHFERVLAGLFLGGLIYSCYGLFVGTISLYELEGIFLIVLLANIDVGWLQNPIYYKESTSRQIIEILPGFLPVQLASTGAFTDEAPLVTIWGSLLYAGTFLLAAVMAFGLRIRRQVTRIISERKYYIKVFLITYVVWIAAFEIVGRYAATLNTHNPTTFLDGMIPLYPNFVWFYELGYIFPILPLIAVKDFHRLNIALLSVVLANISAFVVYLAYPIAFPRPELGQSLAEQILHIEYISDFHPGANKLPSMHVAFTWLAYLVVHKQGLGKIGEGIVLTVTILITVSTLFVKQHIIFDVAAGILWAFLSWRLATYLYPKLTNPNTSPTIALRQMFKKLFSL
jgi:membrane-associated phospholipid phosphatase